MTGPTGSGKTSLALDIAERLRIDIISADSRQIYRGIPIGTAAPTPEQLARARHHLVGILNLDEYYSAARYEEDALALISRQHMVSDYALVCGGSMMYVDAVVNGLDNLPDISEEVRRECLEIYRAGGIEALREEVRTVDGDYYKTADLNNHKRLIHCLEISRQAGVPYSSLRTGKKKSRPFEIRKFAIDFPREVLFSRINSRVDEMIASGLEEEARGVYHLKHLNSLNTVGYKEMFAYFEGILDYPTMVSRIAKNTRVYAKKQLTWLKKDPATRWLNPDKDLLNQILAMI